MDAAVNLLVFDRQRQHVALPVEDGNRAAERIRVALVLRYRHENALTRRVATRLHVQRYDGRTPERMQRERVARGKDASDRVARPT